MIRTVRGFVSASTVRYSPDRGSIRYRLEVAGETAAVEVSDQALAIESTDMPGAGLALYLCRELARVHCGDISASSVPPPEDAVAGRSTASRLNRGQRSG